MKLLVFKTKEEAAKKAAEEFCNLVEEKPNAVLGLATGETMIPFYKDVVKISKKRKLDFSKVTTFNLDEYADLKNPLRDKNSYHYYMEKNFFSKVNIGKSNMNFPSASGEDYDAKIKKSGGLDLCLLGIGENGHIAFNEPGSSFKSRTRKVLLSEDTRNANSRFFKSSNDVPRGAYTMGIKTIMKSKKIILLAFGSKKSDAVERAMRERVSESVPASVLRRHRDATAFVDSPAAALLPSASGRR